MMSLWAVRVLWIINARKPKNVFGATDTGNAVKIYIHYDTSSVIALPVQLSSGPEARPVSLRKTSCKALTG